VDSSVTPGSPDHDVPTLRPARPDDAPALADLFWQVREENAATIPRIVHPRETVLPFVRSVLAGSEVWAATVREEPVAFCAVGPDGDLDHLYVAGAHTGSGVGSTLLALAQRRNPRGLALWVFASNTGAVRFYERHGFVVVGGTDGDNEEGAPDLRMEWRPFSAGGSRR
jgi:ribosomal protein S18 acetylase RimI-like enzyme